MLKEILSTWDERHSFIVGFAHSFYRFRKPPEKYMEEVISPEFHYYVCGRGIGALTKAGIVIAVGLLILKHQRGKGDKCQ